jgi:hypothetical protein
MKNVVASHVTMVNASTKVNDAMDEAIVLMAKTKKHRFVNLEVFWLSISHFLPIYTIFQI